MNGHKFVQLVAINPRTVVWVYDVGFGGVRDFEWARESVGRREYE